MSLSDRTHDAKINWVYELPIGPGKALLRRGVLSQVIGGWRIGTTQRYASGTPIALTGAFGFPGNTINNRPTIATYQGLARANQRKQLRPRARTCTSRLRPWPTGTAMSPPSRSRDGSRCSRAIAVGNMTVTNPKVRNFPILSENVALAKTFSLAAENRRELDVRLEGFNVLNRVQFATPNTNLSATPGTFGLVTSQANAPRSLQLALKFVF